MNEFEILIARIGTIIGAISMLAIMFIATMVILSFGVRIIIENIKRLNVGRVGRDRKRGKK